MSKLQDFVGSKISLTASERQAIARDARIDPSATAPSADEARPKQGPSKEPQFKRFALTKKTDRVSNLFAAQASDLYAPNESDFLGYPASDSSLGIQPAGESRLNSRTLGPLFPVPAQAERYDEPSNKAQTPDQSRSPANGQRSAMPEILQSKIVVPNGVVLGSEQPSSAQGAIVHVEVTRPTSSGSEEEYDGLGTTHTISAQRAKSVIPAKRSSNPKLPATQRSYSEDLRNSRDDFSDELVESIEGHTHHPLDPEPSPDTPPQYQAAGSEMSKHNRFANPLYRQRTELIEKTQEAVVDEPPAQTPAPQSDDFDYTSEQLSDMAYKDLLDESFDKDPKKEVSLDQSLQGKPLEEQLSHMLWESPEAQQPFLAGLSQNEWDAAGEWFMTKYAELASKMASARTKKRKAAQEFEQEVYQRQDSVERKVDAIDNALEEIRSGGSKLLDPHRTPRR